MTHPKTTRTRPNILVFVTHDTGRQFGCYGIETVNSPNIDRLAAEGVRFTRFFATAANCCPSRGAMFTGLYPPTNGIMGLIHSPFYWKFRDGVRHLSHHLRDAGYRTISACHQHETLSPRDDLAFDEYIEGRHASDVIEKVPGRIAALVDAEQPFYMQVGTFETHRPYLREGTLPEVGSRGVTVPPLYVRNDTSIREFAELQASIKRVDDAVGAVLDALNASGLADNTIVVFTVDHGMAFPRAKGTLYDTGLETALLMRWPDGGIGGGRTSDLLLSNVDLAPTLLELASIQPTSALEGVSFAPGCASIRVTSPRDAIFGQHNCAQGGVTARCIRTDRWKLIRNFSPSRTCITPVNLDCPDRRIGFEESERPVVELYDLQADPLELNNVAADPEHAEAIENLSRMLLEHLERVTDPILQGPVVWPYYEMAMAAFKTSANHPGISDA